MSPVSLVRWIDAFVVAYAQAVCDHDDERRVRALFRFGSLFFRPHVLL